jgi:hypothetical protein
MKLASKKGKTFADVAKPIQNLIEKLKDKPQSQAVKNSRMLLEKQLDDLFAQQEAMKPQPQVPQDMNQMIQNPQEEMMEGMPQQEDPMGMMQPQMGYGGYLYKHFAGETVGNPFNPVLDNRTYYRKPIINPELTDDELGAEQDFRYARINSRPTFQNKMGPMNRPAGYVDPNQVVQNNIGPVFGQEGNSSMMNAQPTYNNNIFQPRVASIGDVVRNQSNSQELRTALNEQTQEEEPTEMATFGRKNSKINYDDPTFVDKSAPDTNPYNNWGEVGALATGMAGMAAQTRNIADRPGDLQRVYLGNGPRPNLPDYANEKNQINADAAAIREAIKLGGGNQGANLSRNWAQQLEARGRVANEEARQRNAILNAYNDRVANLGVESQKLNLGIDTSNRDTRFGYDQMVNEQKNAAIANATQLGADVFNNRTKYSNQLAQAQIMANAHPESVWADAQGNKFYVTPQGKKIPLAPQTEEQIVSATNPTGVNMVPAATPVTNTVVTPIRKTNSKNQNIVSSDGGKTWQVEGTTPRIKTNIVNGKKVQKSYAEGGSVYRKALQEQINQPTIANAAAMDAEYQQNLNAGNKSFKSSITGLEYKVLPRSEKDLYAANMWKELHGTAPTKPQVAATKKAIEGKKTSSPGAKTVAETIDSTFSMRDNPKTKSDWGENIERSDNLQWRNKFYNSTSNEIRDLGYNPMSKNDFNINKPSWITPEMENLNTIKQQQDSKNIKEKKTVSTLKMWNPAAASYYEKTGDLQGALDNYVAPDRFDVSSGSAGYSIGNAVREGTMGGVDYLNTGMLLAGAFGARKAGANPKLKQLNEKNPRLSNVRSTPEERTVQGTKNWKYQTEQTPGLQEYYDKKAKMFREVNPKVKYTDPLKEQGKLEPSKQKLLPGATKTSIDNEDEAFALDFNKRQNAIANDKMDRKLKVQEGADNYTKASLKRMDKRLDNMEVDSYGKIKMEEKTLNNLQKAELFKIKNLERQMKLAKKAGDTKKYNRLQAAYLNSMEID